MSVVIRYYGLKMPTRIKTDTLLITDPNAYVDVVDAPDTIPITIKLSFVNNEGRTLYIKVELIDAPEEYSMDAVEVGSVGNGAKINFSATVNRTKPETTDFMELEESITLRVSAYTDSEYTALYSYVDVPVTVYIINSAHPNWSVVKEYEFDDGSLSDLSHQTEVFGYEEDCKTRLSVTSSTYVTPPYSCLIDYYMGRYCSRYAYAVFTVDLTSYSKAYLVAYVRKINDPSVELKVVAGDKVYYFTLPEANVWYKIVIPLETSEITVKIGVCILTYPGYTGGGIYVDSIKVLAV